jgi:arabinofuranosyltransferase
MLTGKMDNYRDIAFKHQRFGKLMVVLFVFLFIVVVLKSAWLGDDAYITFRTVDNFINGYGLTWNPVERVQVFTHPLWMFLVSAVYFFTREIYYSSIILSVVISVLSILILAFGIAPSPARVVLGLTILIFSKAFVDYSTSGLENPLTHLLWVSFLYVYLKFEINPRTIFLLFLIAGLATFNRVDTLLLYLPALVYILIQFGRLQGLLIAGAGFLPFILWEFFSLFYYGLLFPNTAYAKLNTGINQWKLVERGLYYLQDSVMVDPLTLLAIAGGILVPFIDRSWRKIPIVIGIVLYLLYIVRLTAPLLGAVVLLIDSKVLAQKVVWIPVAGAVVLVGLASPYPPLLSDGDFGLEHETLDARVVEDERAHYYQGSGLFSNGRKTGSLDHLWAIRGREAGEDNLPVVVKAAIGYFGFYAGPDVYVLNSYALSDPLLARLPSKFRQDWVIGHSNRRIPTGYLETLKTGQNLLVNKDLAVYYDKLSFIVRGELFDVNRVLEIWNFNLGKYDYLLASYPPTLEVNMATTDLKGEVIKWNPLENPEQFAAIAINFNKPYQATRIEIELVPVARQLTGANQNTDLLQCRHSGSRSRT